jgi:hypothetical protein
VRSDRASLWWSAHNRVKRCFIFCEYLQGEWKKKKTFTKLSPHPFPINNLPPAQTNLKHKHSTI